jgi:ankyrin repeat protein
LYGAVSRGDVAEVARLLDQGSDPNAASPPFGFTPLTESAGLKPEITLLLLESGADPNLADRRGWTPLAAAAYRSSKEDVESLLRFGGEPRATMSYGDDAGRQACDLIPGDSPDLKRLLC